MKIGKGPKRFGGPSAAFKARQAAKVAAASQTPPTGGGVMLFLDDERRPPDGWTLVKSPGALEEQFANHVVACRVTMLSLDWHLGTGVTNGQKVAERIAERLADPSFLPRLEGIYLHSSDPDRARDMARTLGVAATATDRDLMIMIGRP